MRQHDISQPGHPQQSDRLARASELIALARTLITSDSGRVRDLASEASELVGTPTTTAGRALALASAMLLVKALYQLGDLAGALEIGQAAMARTRGSRASADLFALISRMTWVYADIGRFGHAMELSQRAFRMAHSHGRRDWEALAYSDLGVIYDRWDKPEEGRDALLRSAEPELLEALQGEEKALICYNVAEIYLKQGEVDRALAYVETGLASAHTSYLLARRGAVLAALGQDERAEMSLRAAHQLACEVHDFYDQFDSLQELARLMRRQGRIGEAITTLQRAVGVAEKAPMLQIGSLKLLAEIYAGHGDYQAAYECMRRVDVARQVLYSEQVTRQTRALELEFRAEIARREAEIERKKNAELRATIGELERLQRELHELSIRDPLTGLFNRRYLMAQLEIFLAQAARRGEPICVAIFDIDHFKEINDRFSHQIGDRVLQQVAAIAQSQIRSCDVLARYGGEEFVVLLAGASLSAGIQVCERLRHQIATFAWSRLQAVTQVTISIGLASSADQGAPLDVDAILRSADDKMYAAKAEGRNQLRY